MPNLPFAHLGSTLTPVRTKRKQKLKRLNILVVGGSKVGKSSLVEHLLLTLNREEARDIFAAQNQSVLPFGNLVFPTTKIVEYPISTDTLRVKLIDTPGISDADWDQAGTKPPVAHQFKTHQVLDGPPAGQTTELRPRNEGQGHLKDPRPPGARNPVGFRLSKIG